MEILIYFGFGVALGAVSLSFAFLGAVLYVMRNDYGVEQHIKHYGDNKK